MSVARYPALRIYADGIRNGCAIRIDSHHRCILGHSCFSFWNCRDCVCARAGPPASRAAKAEIHEDGHAQVQNLLFRMHISLGEAAGGAARGNPAPQLLSNSNGGKRALRNCGKP